MSVKFRFITSHKSTGRPLEAENRYTSKYLDAPNTPLYPFGFGLSYTQFNISNLRLDKTQIKSKRKRIKVSVDVENTGRRDGAEVVQLYIRDLAASVTRPVKELKDFRRIALKAGEKRTIEFTLTLEKIGFLNREMKFTVENGDFKVSSATVPKANWKALLQSVKRRPRKKKLN
jgi:beta-glucosidase